MNGFKFVARQQAFQWVHAAEVQAADVDCTDMTEAQFEAQVCRTLGVFNFAEVPA